MNRVQLIGHLGQDPEIRRLENGSLMARFSLATNESYYDKSADGWVSNTEWHTIVAWKGLADKAENLLKRGSKAFVEGKISYSKWTDKSGNIQKSIQIVANNIELITD